MWEYGPSGPFKSHMPIELDEDTKKRGAISSREEELMFANVQMRYLFHVEVSTVFYELYVPST